MDKLSEECPEFMVNYKEAKAAQVRYDTLLRKGQLVTLDYVKDNSSLFQYYTGLPSFAVFQILYNYLYDKTRDMQYVSTAGQQHNTERFVTKPGPKRTLSLMEEMFATLVRLRLGLPSQHCAHLFGISESTYSVIFNTWVIVLANELELICCMPSTDITLETKAHCFDRFPMTRIVLDCTELFAQTPSTLDSHKQLHSNYKHHSTVKFLVGMSPSGTITYISSMWGDVLVTRK